MAGKIPQAFIDQVLARTDIVEVIDRRVPLTRKGKEHQACCPFHDEKTPSFTVSPTKQFYHCFGCGAHGTAVGFLMDYANLGFVEAVEELAAAAGMAMPAREGGGAPAANETAPLLAVVADANDWFQQQLRAPAGEVAVAYLKHRGVDGRTAAEFGIGYAPDGWDNLARALGGDANRRQQLIKAGLVKPRDKGDGDNGDGGVYDRFRNRVTFPIEDHRGRVVAFGGRIIGDGEPKYLNSPETPLFHKGAELYGLHRARRAIGVADRVIVVEGYMDVVGLAQFGVDNAVAALGTATTGAHIQRLFRLASEIVFCFDGDRAGRDAAWKAMQSALPELRDGRQLAFLFLPDGEDPDTIVRAEGKDGFDKRAASASALESFLFDSLIKQVDMQRMDGRARLVSLAKPLIQQLPPGALKEMMFARLSSLSGLSAAQLDTPTPPPRARTQPLQGQLSPLALASSLLLQNPNLAATITDPAALKKIHLRGADTLCALLDKIAADPAVTTARLLESFRGERVHDYLEKLATRRNLTDPAALTAQFNDIIRRLLDADADAQRLAVIERARRGEADAAEVKAAVAARKAALPAHDAK